MPDVDLDAIEAAPSMLVLLEDLGMPDAGRATQAVIHWLASHPGITAAFCPLVTEEVEKQRDEMAERVRQAEAANETMTARLSLARSALIGTGYFTADEVGPDVAPRITELHSALTTQLAEARTENERILDAWAEVIQREQRAKNAHFHDEKHLREELAEAQQRAVAGEVKVRAVEMLTYRNERAAMFWEQIVKRAVAWPEWESFYLANGGQPNDETMVDFLASRRSEPTSSSVGSAPKEETQ